ncbi:MAG: hypothetical protein HZC18_04620 [Candidatus Omnitrophica bacterium]|nr:hypothetical protein [Candidatus Omnitrophota bacterium]
MIQKVSNKKTILLVDDDLGVTQTLGMLLETRGYEVDIAHTGREVFEKITGAIDLILLDLVLPVGSKKTRSPNKFPLSF